MINKVSKTTRDKRVFYGSSYDRGLEHLLRMWPDVKKAVPEAELHIFYGWKLFKQFYANNPERMSWMAEMNKMMEYDGVFHHGRVAQYLALEAMKECGVWGYPTHFGEINCINAIKAQAVGCVPVVINYAALETTVQHGIKIDGDIYDPKVREKFKKELIAILKDPKRQEEIAKKSIPWAKKTFGWDVIAKQWSEDFKRDELKEACETLLEYEKDFEKYLPVGLQEKYGYRQTY